MPKSPEEMMAAIMRNLVARTSRSAQEWAAIGAAVPAGKFTERLKFLQQTQGLGRGQAQAVLWYGEHGADYAPTSYDQLVAAQYAGRRAALRPIFDAVLKAAQTLGDDVEIGARQTYVSFNHGRQFAIGRVRRAAREGGQRAPRSAGSVTVTVVPASTSLRTAMLPPPRVTSSRQTQRPMPRPGDGAFRAAAPRKPKSKT